MNYDDLIEVICKHNLSIRRIPDKVVSLLSISSTEEPLPTDDIVEQNGRKFIRNVRIPEHPGWYMCKEVKHTDTMVRWNIKDDNLAPTLEGSIILYLSKNKD